VTVPASGRGTQVVRSRFDALGTCVELVTAGRPAALDTATRLLRDHLDALDAACGRFRVDCELARVRASAGRAVPVSPLFAAAVAVELWTAEQADGDVDPTLGAALVAAGYDADSAARRLGPEGGPQRTDTVDGTDSATLSDPFRTVRGDRPHRTTHATTAAHIPAMLGSPQGTVTVDGPKATVRGVR
jgi:hypothetical protein